MSSWFRLNSPRIRDTMLFLYLGLDSPLSKEINGSRSFSARLGVHLIVAWDGEFGGPDLQLWANLGFFNFGFGIETNPYIKKGFERG